ncbi:lipase 3-like [Haematobia irritans]|uniref:lipase 3-like n=1 Tax=Haematobia irritans TaxID=7368 RepID=UPI003F503B6B
MKTYTGVLLGILTICVFTISQEFKPNTCDRIIQHGYPCENHTVTTCDGYILTLFRIPHGHGEELGSEEEEEEKIPTVLLMNCWQCSSDIWVIMGPNSGLPFLLADAGYDVWLGNARGNIYSEHHLTMSPMSENFWEFAIDEIGQIDLPAKVDYILSNRNQTRLHFVGYSQSTAFLMMMLSSKPEYNQKLSTIHLLAPSIFICHPRSALVMLMSRLLGIPNTLSKFLGTLPFQGILALFRSLSTEICKQPSNVQGSVDIINFALGWGSPYLNRTLLLDLLYTTPAGGSNRQSLQVLQSVMTCHFRSYDYGAQDNLKKYGQSQPPDYNLTNIDPLAPIEIYFSDNDFLISVEDVYELYKVLGEKANWNRVKYKKYNHLDLVLAYNVKTCINDCIVDKIQQNEGRPFKGTLCKCFRRKPFH